MTERLLDPDFVTGLAAGVVSAVGLWLAARLWVHGVMPRVRRWLYRGVNISGEWQGLGTGYTPAHGEWSELVLQLQQDIQAVHGVVTLRSRSANQSFEVKLHVTGTLSDGYVALNLLPADESLPSPASALLKLEDGGRALNGQLLYRHPFLDIVDLIDISVHRTQPAASPHGRPATIAAAPSFADTNPAERHGARVSA
jgi:hypothetical protein